MATDTDLALRVRSALAEYLKRDVTTIKPADALRNDLGLDSLTTIELLYRIEEEFDVEVPDTDLPGLVTVADVTAYLQRRATQALQPRSSLNRRLDDAEPSNGVDPRPVHAVTFRNQRLELIEHYLR
jgi:acyl carrier protein